MARNVLIDLIGRDNASPAFLRVGEAAERAAGRVEKAQARLGKAGATMTRNATLPFLVAAGAATAYAVKYQKANTLIQTAGGETAKKAAAISKGILVVARQTGTALDQLQEGIYTVAKAGSQKWSAAAQLNVLKVAAEGAKAENVDLGTSVNALTSVMMSYHKSASQAVKVENQIIVGSGRAKTTMQEYGGALSTVVPIASAAHVKFNQVAGAIATMTQHGTSADEATQELAHTIKNLQQPNGVAIKAMQQLGLNVTDVSKNLGKRGLTGTIDLLTNSIAKKLGPNGLVTVDTFKKSQSASADLSLELSHMPKHLADISRQFQTGKMSYKDYYTAVKDLGGQQYALGKDFISTQRQASGFNDLLRSGQPAAKTFAGYLYRVMGTAVGLNTALQLGGENMKYFKQTTKDVGAAALKAGSDVLGWNKTQDTLAVKMDKAKASLQVLAVEIGTMLIPAVSKIVSWLQQGVDWFTHLTDTQKKVLLWSAGVMAAMGPVLTIGSRLILIGRAIGTFTTGISSAITRMAGTTEASAARVNRAVGGMTSALTGVGIGVGIAQLTKHSSTAGRAIGALASTAAGAAVGFGVGGPLGAGIGAVTGLVSNLATQFLQSGQSAKDSSAVAQAALQQQKQDADDLFESLKAVNGQYNKQFKSSIVSKLVQHGAYDYAAQAHVSPGTITKAALGQVSAIRAIQAKVAKYLHGVKMPGGGTSFDNPALDKVVSILADVSPAVRRAEVQLEQYRSGMNKTLVPQKLLAKGADGLTKALKGTGIALTTSADKQVASSALAQRNSTVIGEYVDQVNKAAKADLAHGKSAGEVAASVRRQTGAIRDNLIHLGFNKRAVDDLIASDLKVPKSVLQRLMVDPSNAKTGIKGVKTDFTWLAALITRSHPKMVVDTGGAHDAVTGFGSWFGTYVDALSNKHVKLHVDTVGTISGNGKLPKGPAQITSPHHAAGGAVRDGWFTAGESGWELGRKTGPNVDFYDHHSSMRMTGLPDRLPGFASGTDSAKEKAKQAAAKAKAAAANAIGKIGTPYSPPFTLVDVGIDLLRHQIKAARQELAKQIDKGLSSDAAARMRDQIKRLADLAKKQLHNLRVTIHGHDLDAIRHAIATGTAQDVRTAFSALLGDERKAGASSALIKTIERNRDKLLGAMKADTDAQKQVQKSIAANAKAIDNARSKLQAMRTYQSSVQTSLTSGFDPTMYGSVADLITGLHGQTHKDNQYTAAVRKLRREHLNKRLLNQLINSGDTATLQTLAGASAGQIAKVNKAAGTYQGSLHDAGNLATSIKFGKTVSDQAHHLDQLTKEGRDLRKEMRNLVHALHEMATKSDDILIDGEKVGKRVVHSKAFDRFLDDFADSIGYGHKP